jgi:hypothetical protein
MSTASDQTTAPSKSQDKQRAGSTSQDPQKAKEVITVRGVNNAPAWMSGQKLPTRPTAQDKSSSDSLDWRKPEMPSAVAAAPPYSKQRFKPSRPAGYWDRLDDEEVEVSNKDYLLNAYPTLSKKAKTPHEQKVRTKIRHGTYSDDEDDKDVDLFASKIMRSSAGAPSAPSRTVRQPINISPLTDDDARLKAPSLPVLVAKKRRIIADDEMEEGMILENDDGEEILAEVPSKQTAAPVEGSAVPSIAQGVELAPASDEVRVESPEVEIEARTDSRMEEELTRPIVVKSLKHSSPDEDEVDEHLLPATKKRAVDTIDDVDEQKHQDQTANHIMQDVSEDQSSIPDAYVTTAAVAAIRAAEVDDMDAIQSSDTNAVDGDAHAHADVPVAVIADEAASASLEDKLMPSQSSETEAASDAVDQDGVRDGSDELSPKLDDTVATQPAKADGDRDDELSPELDDPSHGDAGKDISQPANQEYDMDVDEDSGEIATETISSTSLTRSSSSSSDTSSDDSSDDSSSASEGVDEVEQAPPAVEASAIVIKTEPVYEHLSSIPDAPTSSASATSSMNLAVPRKQNPIIIVIDDSDDDN